MKWTIGANTEIDSGRLYLLVQKTSVRFSPNVILMGFPRAHIVHNILWILPTTRSQNAYSFASSYMNTS